MPLRGRSRKKMGDEVTGYNTKMMTCQKHGPVEHFLGYDDWICMKCFFEDMKEDEKENIRIVAELNMNEVEC